LSERATHDYPDPRGAGDPGLISVVVIVRNGERFLAEALESIAAQTLSAWETIIVDDGSSDGTRAIAADFARRDARFRLVAHPGGANRGMSASRNLGRAHAKGGFLVFLDHDDAMDPTKLARQRALLEAHPEVGAVVHPNLRWESWRGDGTPDWTQDLGADEGVLAPPGLLPSFLARTSATPQSPLVRMEAFDAVGGYDERFPAMCEDQVFLAKLSLAVPVLVSHEVLHRYRQHDDSCVFRSRREGRHRAERRRFLRWLRYEVRGQPGDRALRALVAREMRRSWLASLRARLWFWR
jgi:glycosyltransferase involved in cell wall biosynthesis